jgi:predicted transcriptional regulator
VAEVFYARFLQNGSVDPNLASIENILSRRLEANEQESTSIAAVDLVTYEGQNKLREAFKLDLFTDEEWAEMKENGMIPH